MISSTFNFETVSFVILCILLVVEIWKISRKTHSERCPVCGSIGTTFPFVGEYHAEVYVGNTKLTTCDICMSVEFLDKEFANDIRFLRDTQQCYDYLLEVFDNYVSSGDIPHATFELHTLFRANKQKAIDSVVTPLATEVLAMKGDGSLRDKLTFTFLARVDKMV